MYRSFSRTVFFRRANLLDIFRYWDEMRSHSRYLQNEEYYEDYVLNNLSRGRGE